MTVYQGLPAAYCLNWEIDTFDPSVLELQSRLRREGIDVPVDGYFGDKTQAAIKEFQRGQNLVPDGIVGPKTLAAFEDAAGWQES